jgi:hypothetical protein
MTPTGRPSMKGSRHPQANRLSSGSVATRIALTPAPSVYPTSVPNSSQLPKKPRRRSGAYSATRVSAPVYSRPRRSPAASG